MKKKSPDQAPPDFKHNPFKALKGLKPTTAGPAPAPKTAKPARKESAEEGADLFLRAVDGVKAIHLRPEDGSGKVRTGTSAKPPAPPAPDEGDLFLQAMQKIGATFREEPFEQDEEGTPRQSASGRMRQLKRGTIRIGEELDLHGYLKDEALVRLEHFVTAAYGRGQKAVLVITGKGINSPEGPVLQGAVDAWLRGKGKVIVAEFAPAPRDKGGSGAFVVFLKSRK